jgi:hypothetical protein
MEFMLFLMFFTSPPAAKAHPVWTLHGTNQFQFISMEACVKYGQHLQNLMDTTDTVKMRGWCVDQGSGVSTFAAKNPYCKDAKPAAEQKDANKAANPPDTSCVDNGSDQPEKAVCTNATSLEDLKANKCPRVAGFTLEIVPNKEGKRP